MSTDEVAKRVAETDTKKKPVAEMVMEALGNLMDKKGSSLQAIKKYMASFYAVDINRQAIFIRKFLKAAVEKGTVEQVKGSGTSGRFRIPKDVVKAKEKKAAKESKKTAKKKVSQASDDDKSSSEEQEEEPAEKPGAPAKKAEKTLKKTARNCKQCKEWLGKKSSSALGHSTRSICQRGPQDDASCSSSRGSRYDRSSSCIYI
ncbi:unnamed protein product [Trichogramma brassicae]|uniref:H15 domain-containing protein n=1 Tax=Trichogramma brassicae TaxID=86971 RepID=A0A6H5IQB9_9HYME|nr:unnamed protein product [Trichogramma brassicae]